MCSHAGRKSNWICALFACKTEMNMKEQNKMSAKPVCSLIWQMGLPMIVSMILQAVYNIVDTAFVINCGEEGVAGNLALTFAFPVQLLIIAVGVATGYFLRLLFTLYFFCSGCSAQNLSSKCRRRATSALYKWERNILPFAVVVPLVR